MNRLYNVQLRVMGFFNIKMTSTASVFRDTILTIFKGSMFARNNTNDNGYIRQLNFDVGGVV
jgi:hypothetical protein